MCGRVFVRETSEMARIIETILNRGNAPDKMKTEGEGFPGDILPVLATDRKKAASAFAMRWGYHLNNRLVINARCETAADKSLFRDGINAHRCVVPVAGYYEWDSNKSKYAIRTDDSITFLAGIYRIEEQPVFVVLTREPGTATSFIHPRMPVIIPREDAGRWIDPDDDPQEILTHAITELICLPVQKEA